MHTKTRLVFSFAIITLAALALLLETAPKGFAQKGGKRGGGFGGQDGSGGAPDGGGKKGKMAFKMDPGAIFDRMSGGKDFISIESMRMGKEQAAEWAKKEGITNGNLTRDQFTKYMELQMQQWQQ